jgi:Uma2 family endonuclease
VSGTVQNDAMGLTSGRAPSEPLTEADARSWPLGIGAVRLRDGLAFVSARDAGRFTLDDLDPIPDDGRRYELLDGVVVVSPSPGQPHQRAVVRVAALLLTAEIPPARTLVAPYDVTLGPARRLQPDVLVLATPEAPTPVLVVEVASTSSRRYDREEKRRAYAEAGIPSYWLVDVDDPAVEVLTLERGRYRTTASASGDAELALTSPFPLRLRPTDLLT